MGRAARRVVRAGVVLAGVVCLLAVLLLLEASGGHDGWLCEWGIDADGAGTTISACGPGRS